MARDYAERAQWSLKEAEDALRSGKSAICVRRTQEALELASKALLRRVAIEYPREHDVGEALDNAAQRLPDYLKSKLDELKAMLRQLAGVGGPAFYGYEVEGIPASEAFTREYATNTLEKTRPLVDTCVRFATE
jgi:HEPN domain-containing protein